MALDPATVVSACWSLRGKQACDVAQNKFSKKKYTHGDNTGGNGSNTEKEKNFSHEKIFWLEMMCQVQVSHV